MKTIISIVMISFTLQGNVWLTDLNKAKQEATANNKFILLNFSGSDWCGPCMRTKKEVFETEEFIKYASEHLILVNADFPRLKKNKLDDALTKSNEALADIYNKEGEFPLTILMDANGKVLKQWVGFPKESVTKFIETIKAISDGAK
jgi:thioredoxin-related protein